MRSLFLVFFLLPLAAPLLGQEPRRGRKPVLIREEQTEKKDEEEEIFLRDPEQAKKNVEVGDFYLKKKNFLAAEKRYRNAIKYNTEWPKSYEKLITLFERQGDFDSAIEVCYEFVEANPASKKAGEFEKKADRFKQQRCSEP
jgi:outer membrane protein assembly factor BamD (BamD/ComL family)